MSLVKPDYPSAVAALLKPVDSQAPAGLFDIEDPDYQAIDQEMIKLGGLHQSSIDWEFIEETAAAYLSTRCKHFRVMSHLLSAWLHKGQVGPWCSGLALLSGMVEQYWATAHPKPGPTGYPAKRKQVLQMLERLHGAFSALLPQSLTVEELRSALAAVARLQAAPAETQLAAPALLGLATLLARQGTGTDPTSAQSVPTQSLDLHVPAKSGGLGSERETRRAALTMAELINQQDLYDPSGYQLRRFALWGHIHTAPTASRERLTELAGVPRDLSEGYREALGGASVEPALLLRIEKSVVAAPFWLRGSYLAASTAVRLAMEDVAAAIHLASVRFARRVPGLLHLCFSDGTPFACDQTRAWLTAARSDDSGARGMPEYAALRDELVAQLAREGVEVVLLRLQAMQAGPASPRQRCHASVIAADLLGARGLTWLANDLYANAARLMAGTPADAWEPDLYRRLRPGDNTCTLAKPEQ